MLTTPSLRDFPPHPDVLPKLVVLSLQLRSSPLERLPPRCLPAQLLQLLFQTGIVVFHLLSLASKELDLQWEVTLDNR